MNYVGMLLVSLAYAMVVWAICRKYGIGFGAYMILCVTGGVAMGYVAATAA